MEMHHLFTKQFAHWALSAFKDDLITNDILDENCPVFLALVCALCSGVESKTAVEIADT